MENKILLIATIASSLFAILAPMPVHNYKAPDKDSTTIRAEKYLHDLEEENNHKVEILKHDVDSLLTIKRKIKYIYIQKKDSL
jgi:hypothetical protein